MLSDRKKSKMNCILIDLRSKLQCAIQYIIISEINISHTTASYYITIKTSNMFTNDMSVIIQIICS